MSLQSLEMTVYIRKRKPSTEKLTPSTAGSKGPLVHSKQRQSSVNSDSYVPSFSDKVLLDRPSEEEEEELIISELNNHNCLRIWKNISMRHFIHFSHSNSLKQFFSASFGRRSKFNEDSYVELDNPDQNEGIPVPPSGLKPSWRCFTYAEICGATNNFHTDFGHGRNQTTTADKFSITVCAKISGLVSGKTSSESTDLGKQTACVNTVLVLSSSGISQVCWLADNLVGKGGYAEVYKGTLPDGQMVAVKRLANGNTDEQKDKEFLTELGTIGHVRHPNTASLVGCCIENGLHLIFHFSAHGSLASFLHGNYLRCFHMLFKYPIRCMGLPKCKVFPYGRVSSAELHTLCGGLGCIDPISQWCNLVWQIVFCYCLKNHSPLLDIVLKSNLLAKTHPKVGDEKPARVEASSSRSLGPEITNILLNFCSLEIHSAFFLLQRNSILDIHQIDNTRTTGMKTPVLEWAIRYKVAVGTARGLHYLHKCCQRRIIHRDIKASNVLLDKDFEPQVTKLKFLNRKALWFVCFEMAVQNDWNLKTVNLPACIHGTLKYEWNCAYVVLFKAGNISSCKKEISDFGLAKWLPSQWTHHSVTPIEGTFGYLAPEYFMHGIVDEKTDVYAFGVLLLEIISGRRPIDAMEQNLVFWAKPLLESGNIQELVDPGLRGQYDIHQMQRMVLTASLCIRHSAVWRPTMMEVLQLLVEGQNHETADYWKMPACLTDDDEDDDFWGFDELESSPTCESDRMLVTKFSVWKAKRPPTWQSECSQRNV
eukprot:Gb_24419 [translate_table: standard]